VSTIVLTILARGRSTTSRHSFTFLVSVEDWASDRVADSQAYSILVFVMTFWVHALRSRFGLVRIQAPHAKLDNRVAALGAAVIHVDTHMILLSVSDSEYATALVEPAMKTSTPKQSSKNPFSGSLGWPRSRSALNPVVDLHDEHLPLTRMPPHVQYF
jgi:hypothetical protein